MLRNFFVLLCKATLVLSFSLAATFLSVPATQAKDLAPLLTITTNAGQVLRTLSLSQIDALPQNSFATSTQWTSGVHMFSGPSLKALIAFSGVTQGVIHAVAVNNYSVDINVADLTDKAPIIATRIDGKTFDVRHKGPLWVVYPYDASSDFRSEVTFANSIWQLTKIMVEPK